MLKLIHNEARKLAAYCRYGYAAAAMLAEAGKAQPDLLALGAKIERTRERVNEIVSY